MLRRRIVPCLDVAGGRVVKGVRFLDLRDMGDPVEAAVRYAEQGADEICWLNITATEESWRDLLAALERAAELVDVPVTVGGGVSAEVHVRDRLAAGADKVSINSSALRNPDLIADCAAAHGSQCIVVAIDAKEVAPDRFEAFAAGGRTATGVDAVAWAAEATRRGAGELLVTSMDADGTKAGYATRLLQRILDVVGVPVIASGGAARPDHLAEALELGCTAALAASIFHEATYTIEEVKQVCRARGLPMR